MNTPKLLLIDDEEMLLQMGELMLKRLGCNVQLAADGGTALDQFLAANEAGEKFDLVIADLTVDEGLGACDILREMKIHDPSVKVVVSSGYVTDPVMLCCREYGFVEKLAKPYRLDDLKGLLENVIGFVPK